MTFCFRLVNKLIFSRFKQTFSYKNMSPNWLLIISVVFRNGLVQKSQFKTNTMSLLITTVLQIVHRLSHEWSLFSQSFPDKKRVENVFSRSCRSHPRIDHHRTDRFSTLYTRPRSVVQNNNINFFIIATSAPGFFLWEYYSRTVIFLNSTRDFTRTFSFSSLSQLRSANLRLQQSLVYAIIHKILSSHYYFVWWLS